MIIFINNKFQIKAFNKQCTVMNKLDKKLSFLYSKDEYRFIIILTKSMKNKVVYQFRWFLVVWLLVFIYLSGLILIKLPFFTLNFFGFKTINNLFDFLFAITPKFRLDFQIYNLQTIAVWISGIIGGPIIGVIVTSLYLILGFLGLPVFPGGGGLDYYNEPTFGYLLSLPLLAFLAGYFNKKGKKTFAVFLPILSTHLIGISYLFLFKQKFLPFAWHLSYSMIGYDLLFAFLITPIMPLISFFVNELFIQEIQIREPLQKFENKTSSNKALQPG